MTKKLKQIAKEVTKEINNNKKLLDIINYSDDAYVETLLYIDVLSDIKDKIKYIIKNNGTINDLVKTILDIRTNIKQEQNKIEYRFLKTIYSAIAFIETQVIQQNVSS